MSREARFGILTLIVAAVAGWRVWHGPDGVVAGLCFFYALWWLGLYVYRTSGEPTHRIGRASPPWWFPLPWVLFGLLFLLAL
jgi:hypothetical protein